MTIDYNYIQVVVDTAALAGNFRLMQAAGGNCMAVVKSDAYGHGLYEAAAAFARAGADTMAVGTVGEALKLRAMPYDGRIVVLLGVASPEECQAAHAQGIVPFVGRFEQLRMMAAAASPHAPAAVALKFDTGMARLGFTEAQVPEVVETLRGLEGRVRPVLAASHLAVADEAGEDAEAFTLAQGAAFGRIVAALREAGFPVRGTLANSAGTLAYPGLRFDMQRPGIALYGANPLHGTDKAALGAGLRPTMRVGAPVLQVHALAKGTPIHYGRTFVAKRDMTVAIIGAGYADCVSRGLSSAGQRIRAWCEVRGLRAPLVGRVCMQMSALDVTDVPGVSAGDLAYILGGEGDTPIAAEELAAWWGTITYEAFCLLGMNPRTYV
ncbi:MAG: alanine racemase [Desulfovibrionaceae bacterium]